MEDLPNKDPNTIEICLSSFSHSPIFLTLIFTPFLLTLKRSNITFTFLREDLLKGVLFDGIYILKVPKKNIVTLSKENVYIAITLPQIQTDANGKRDIF